MSTATFLTKYKVLNKIGEGSFSEVLKCKDLRHGIFLAAKRLKKRFNSVEDVFGSAEIIAMQKLSRHPNILYMIEFHYDSFLGKVTFLFELMDMSLYDFINARSRPVPEARAKYYLFQILCGLEHLHKNGIFHRDIKPENILIKMPENEELSNSFKCEIIKIGDLGSIRGIYSSPPFTEYISTRWYRSPECLLTAGYYGPKMDIWAAGCVYYELLTFKPLFAGSNEVDQLSKIHHVLGTPTSRVMSKFLSNKSCNYDYFPKRNGIGLNCLLPLISADGLNVMRLMIVYDPDVRSNVKRLLEQKYFMHLKLADYKINNNRKRSSSVEPVGDYKLVKKSNIRKSTAKQDIMKDEDKEHKRSFNDIFSNKKFKSSDSIKNLIKDSLLHTEKKVNHSSNSNDTKYKSNSYKSIQKNISSYKNESEANDGSKKFKSNSYKSLFAETSIHSKEYKYSLLKNNSNYIKSKSDSFKNSDRKPSLYNKQPKLSTFGSKHKKTCESSTHLERTPDYNSLTHTFALRKYIKSKKELETYRNTTGNIHQVFNKSYDTTKQKLSKSFVLPKASTKKLCSNPEFPDRELTLNPRSKIVFVDHSTKIVSKYSDKRRNYKN